MTSRANTKVNWGKNPTKNPLKLKTNLYLFVKKNAFPNFYLFNEKKVIARTTPSTLKYVLECYDHKILEEFWEKQNAM